jgi:hypothetical protein
MTVNQIINRLSANATEFMLAGAQDKAEACMVLLATIKNKGYQNLRGTLMTADTNV